MRYKGHTPNIDTTIVDSNEDINDISTDDVNSDINLLKEDSLSKKDMKMDFTGMDYSVEYGKGFPVTVTSADSNLTGVITYIVDNESYLNTSFFNERSGTILQGLGAGYYSVEVFYHDDVNYNDCSISYDFRIIRADMDEMNISIVNQDNSTNLTHGDLITVVVTFMNDKESMYLAESGNLSFSLDNVNWFDEAFTGGTGYHIFDNLNASDYTIYIKYSGDINYRSGSGSSTFTVNKKSLDITIPEIIYVEEGLELDFPNDITGALTVLIDETEYNYTFDNSKILISFADFDYGSHNVKISYDGDNNFNPFAVESTIDLQSNKVNTAIYANNLTMLANKAKNFTITLKDIDGNLLSGRIINITFNGENYALVSDENGQVNFYLSNLSVKTYDLSVKFLGDVNYNKSSGFYKIIVNKVSTTISASNLSIYAFNTKNLILTLKDADGKVLASKKVIIKFNGKNYTRTTNSKGQATLSIKSTLVKNYTATIKFAGDNIYKSSSKSVKVTIKTAYVTVADIIKRAKYLKAYSAKYKKLPKTRLVGSINCTHPQLVYLMTVAIKKINAKKKLSSKVKVLKC